MSHKPFILALAGAAILAAGCEEAPTALDAQSTDASLVEASASDTTPNRSRMRRGGNPIRGILAQSEALELTASQIAQIEEIQANLRAENEPLLEQLGDAARGPAVDREELAAMTPGERRERLQELREARRAEMEAMTPEQRAAQREERRTSMEANREVLAEVRENTRGAVESAMAVLTDDQRTNLEAMREARRDAADGRDGGRRRGGRGGSRG